MTTEVVKQVKLTSLELSGGLASRGLLSLASFWLGRGLPFSLAERGRREVCGLMCGSERDCGRMVPTLLPGDLVRKEGKRKTRGSLPSLLSAECQEEFSVLAKR